jgi:hypothetical protein
VIEGTYVLKQVPVVRALEYTGDNREALLEWACGMVHSFDDEPYPFLYDTGTDRSIDIKPGMVVVEYDDGAVGTMKKAEFNELYERM